MMHSLRGLSFLGGCMVLAGLILPAALGQGRGPNPADAKVILRGRDNLDKLVAARENREAWNALVKSERAYSDQDKDIVDMYAQWHTYRLTWTWFHDEPARMDALVREFDRDLMTAQKHRPNADRFIDAYVKQAMVYLKDVLQNDRGIARVNGGRVLARLGGTGVEDSADLLLETLQDPKQIDAVKFNALRGLQAFFNQTRGDNRIRLRDEERERKLIAALNAFLLRKPSPQMLALLTQKEGDTPPSEDEPALRTLREEVAAFHWVRRETAKALGETRHPTLVGKDKKPIAETTTALSLLKLCRADGFEPPPDLAEQVEAAVAVCQLEADLTNLYQTDYAAALIGRFIADFLQKGIEEREAKKEPWKLHTNRLMTALDDFKNNSRSSPGRDYVNGMVGKARPMLDQFERGQAPKPAEMTEWLGRNPPKSPSLYRGIDSAVVKSAEG